MKIKPCPFCARDKAEVYKFNDRCYTVTCPCGAESPNDSVSESGAVRIWNRRRWINFFPEQTKGRDLTQDDIKWSHKVIEEYEKNN